MREPERKCSICRALIDEEDLFCANCGAEAPQAEAATDKLSTTFSSHNFNCTGCGASMSYDASAQNLRCPFCGSEKLDKQSDGRIIAPRKVVPFTISRERANNTLRGWLGTGWLRPSDLSDAAVVTKMAAVYVPYWVFRAKTFTFWTADTSDTPRGARGDWVPMSGEHRGNYSGVLVGASRALAPNETHALCPFDLAAAVEPEKVDLTNFTTEQFSVQRKYARPLARQGLESLERKAVDERYIPGRSRNVKVNTMLDGLSSEPVLLPVWIVAYRYQDKVYRFLMNGQTGSMTGRKPTSMKKIVLIVVAVVAAAILALICAGIVAGASAATSQRKAEPSIQSIVGAQPGAGSFHLEAVSTQTDNDHVRTIPATRCVPAIGSSRCGEPGVLV